MMLVPDAFKSSAHHFINKQIRPLILSDLRSKCCRQVTVSPNPINPLVLHAIAFSPVCLVDSICRSMLLERSKTFSMGALMEVVRIIFRIVWTMILLIFWLTMILVGQITHSFHIIIQIIVQTKIGVIPNKIGVILERATPEINQSYFLNSPHS